MPKDNAAKTGSGLRNYSLVILLICVFLGVLFYFESIGSNNRIRLGSNVLRAEIADDDTERIKGLSFRKNLDKDEAMLFVFDRDDKHCMWMKDMNFALDMVWLNEQKVVVKIEKNVRPETYPNSFCSDQPARYVIEVNAGIIDSSGVELGQTAHF